MDGSYFQLRYEEEQTHVWRYDTKEKHNYRKNYEHEYESNGRLGPVPFNKNKASTRGNYKYLDDAKNKSIGS